MFVVPDSKRCAEVYGEGPDAGEGAGAWGLLAGPLCMGPEKSSHVLRAGPGQRETRLVELGRRKREVKSEYCGRPEWADKDGCPIDNPNEEMTSCAGCVWLKDAEGQE